MYRKNIMDTAKESKWASHTRNHWFDKQPESLIVADADHFFFQ